MANDPFIIACATIQLIVAGFIFYIAYLMHLEVQKQRQFNKELEREYNKVRK